MIEVCGIVVGTLVVTFLALPWVFKLYDRYLTWIDKVTRR